MLRAADMLSKGDIVAIDRTYMDYCKHEAIMRIGAFYVTKMKKGLHAIVLQKSDGANIRLLTGCRRRPVLLGVMPLVEFPHEGVPQRCLLAQYCH